LDIKLKNIKYSTGTKTIAVILVWLCFMSAAISGLYLLYHEDILTSNHYYETREFKAEYGSLVQDVVILNVRLENGERDQELKDRISNTVNFAYYMKNSNSGEVIDNIKAEDPITLLKKQPSYVYFNNAGSTHNNLWQGDNIRSMLSSTAFEVHAAVIEPLKQGDAFYEGFHNFSKVKTAIPYVIAAIIGLVIIMLAAFGYLVYAAGRREAGGEVVLSAVDRIYNEVHAFLVFIAAVISFLIVTEIASYTNNDTIVFIVAAIVLSIDVLIGLSYVLSMVRQIKKRQLFSNTLFYRLLFELKKYAALAFGGKMFQAWTLLVLMGYGAGNGILFAIFLSTWRYDRSFEFLFTGLILLGFNVAAVYFAAKSLRNLSQIMEAAKELSGGNLDYSLDSKEMSVAFVDFAEDLQGIQSGLKKAVSEAVKGERMKTELITNVSHDLKTPLTSIINYVDLLKKEQLNNENAEEYLDVLEEKSARLKQLVEDLIEASKATSGNLAVCAEKVDMHQLVMQAYGEYEEKIEKAGLDIRMNAAEKELFALADGKHMWRIVENLLSNALKYSMPNSRVYISIDKSEHYGILTIKNISAYPLEISPEQLTERFIRGEASRTTEGSGLGLSIAQGLTNLQGGRFKVDIDGDLFKVTVEIPLWIED
jgi:signal transduction histidine kinase